MSERDIVINLMKSKLKYYNDDYLKTDYILFTTVRRMINTFIVKGKINENLIFNNIIILYNKYDKLTYLIFCILLDDEKMSIINPFFVFLGIIEKSKNLKLNEYIIDLLNKFSAEYYISNNLLTKE